MEELDPENLQAASLAKDPFEVVAMGLIFQQQKMITELINQLKS